MLLLLIYFCFSLSRIYLSLFLFCFFLFTLFFLGVFDRWALLLLFVLASSGTIYAFFLRLFSCSCCVTHIQFLFFLIICLLLLLLLLLVICILSHPSFSFVTLFSLLILSSFWALCFGTTYCLPFSLLLVGFWFSCCF